MGNKELEKHDKRIASALKQTGEALSRDEVKKYYKKWIDLFNGPVEIDKAQFRKWIKEIGMFPDLQDDIPIDNLFNSHDRDRSGKVSFEEFILYLGIIAPTQKEQDPEKVLEVTFLLYVSYPAFTISSNDFFFVSLLHRMKTMMDI